ncbi:MAG: acetylxylan esterase [Planctomycetes bacterium]|nr:acetylxylan esterase [Planctomycetota bacterium]
MLRKSGLWLLTLTLTAALARGGEAPKPEYAIHGATDKAVAIYQPGEEMVFTLKVLEDGKPVAGKKIKWILAGDVGKWENGEAESALDGVQVKTKADKPGFIRLQAEAFDGDGKKLHGRRSGSGNDKQYGDIAFFGGACVAPEKLASTEEPADFDAFWQGVKADLAAVTMKAELKELEWQHQGVKLYAVKIDCAGPRPVTGYLTIPVGAKEKSLKAALSFAGYGTNKQRRPWHVDPNAIRFDVNAHGMELERPGEYYQELAKKLGQYGFDKDENADPKKTYFYGMACRLLRAFEYVKSRPEWNGKDLASNGGSQGGMQGLWGAALVPEVTSADIWSPWFCDLGGGKAGRFRGWMRPEWTKALDYYDPVFHAKRIKTAQVRLVANYGDNVCPPSGVWIVYNNLATPNKSMEVRQGCTHGFMMENYQSFVVTPEGVKDVQVKAK